MLNLIDVEPIKPGWGRVSQSGVFASQDWNGHGLIVSMAGNENWRPPVLWVDIPDNDVYVMPDDELLAFTDAIISFLRRGRDVLIHCNEGKYRSTYMDVAVHMRGGMVFEDAFALVRKRHTIADLRVATMAQLRRMEI